MGYNMISGINGIFNKITNKKYDEKEEFTETSPLWLRVILVVVWVVVFSVLFYVIVANIRTNAMKRNKRAIKIDHGKEINALREQLLRSPIKAKV